jgi:hypothetical protein
VGGNIERQRIERRLTALLAANVAGYSRLMGADVEGTLAAPKAIRRELVEPWIVEDRGPPCRDDHGGRHADLLAGAASAGSEKGGTGSRWRRQEPAGTSPSPRGMMSTPPPRDHRLYARGNASSKAAGPAVDQYRQWFTNTVYPAYDKVPARRNPARNRTLHSICDHDRKGLGIQPQETISILVAKRSKASIGLN